MFTKKARSAPDYYYSGYESTFTHSHDNVLAPCLLVVNSAVYFMSYYNTVTAAVQWP